MRVLMISDVAFPRVNGVSTSIASFRQALAERHVDTHLIAPDYGQPGPDERGISRMFAARVPRDPEDRRMRYRSILAQVDHWRQMQFDLIHVHTPFVAHYAARALARQLELPVVLTYHTLFEEYFHHYLPFLPKGPLCAAARWFSRRQCDEVDAVIVPSTAMARRLTEYGVTCPLTVLPTGVRLEEFAAGDGAAFRAQMGIAPQRPMALFVGRVAFEKNIDFLIRAIDQARAWVPDLLLVIAGEGPALPALKQLVATRGLQDYVRFVGYLERGRQLPDCYAAADVFVFASRTETQGLVLIEALAMGKPVLALSVMGTEDILRPAKGAQIAADDEGDFALRLANMLRNRLLREEMGRQAQSDAAAWRIETMAERLEALYRQVINEFNADRRRKPASRPLPDPPLS